MKRIKMWINNIRDALAFVFIGIAMLVGSKSLRETLNKAMKIGLEVQLKAFKQAMTEVKEKNESVS